MTLLSRKPLSMAVCIRKLIPHLFIATALSVPLLSAAPGAHGPDGEHLTTASNQQESLMPRFEAFSEVFELVGELQPHALVLHLHDYQTNSPIAEAQIEFEMAALSTPARYIADKNHYLIDDPVMLERLQRSETHEIILTIISADSADLLTATLDLADTTNDAEAAHDHHDHFPWWSLPLGLLVFAAGMLVGRRGATK